MEARHNEQGITVKFPRDTSPRQLSKAIAEIKRHKQVVHVKRVGRNQVAILVDLGQLQGRTAQNSLGLVRAHAVRQIERATTVRRLSRQQLSRVKA